MSTASRSSAGATPSPPESSRVVCHLDRLLKARGMTLASLADRAGITAVNLSVLKNDRAKAIRFTTLVSVCRALECSVGELLEVVPEQER